MEQAPRPRPAATPPGAAPVSLRKPRRGTPDRPAALPPHVDADGAETLDADDVGAFRQGSPFSQWALARYLVGRAIAESVGTALLIVALAILVLAGLIWWAGAPYWAVVIAIVGLAVLGMRALLLAVLRRVTAAGEYAPLEHRMRALVADTRGDVLRELRHLRLPSHTWTLPLLGLRLARRRTRADTMNRLREFRIDRAVPATRLDEVHLLLRSAAGRNPG